MAHEIAFLNVGGQMVAQAAYANTPAWHRLGTVFEPGSNKGMTSEEAAKLSHSDFPVTKEHIYLGNGNVLKNNYALVRGDTGKDLWVVGNDYVVHENREAFNFLDGLIQDGIMRYEAAFCLKEGRGFVLLARMPALDGSFDKGDEIVKGDEMYRYILFSHWHGGGAIQITPTAIRAQCFNMTQMALSMSKAKLSIQHSGELDTKLKSASRYIAQFDKGFTDYRDYAQKLLVGYTPAQAAEYINELFPKPESKRALTYYERKVNEIRKAFRSPAQNLPGVKGTFWALYNSVTEAIDHGDMFSESKDKRKRIENRFMSISDGAGAEIKNKAFELALDMAA